MNEVEFRHLMQEEGSIREACTQDVCLLVEGCSCDECWSCPLPSHILEVMPAELSVIIEQATSTTCRIYMDSYGNVKICIIIYLSAS